MQIVVNGFDFQIPNYLLTKLSVDTICNNLINV